MKKRITGLFLAVLTVCCVVFSMAVPASAAYDEEEEIQELTRDWGDKKIQTAADGNQYTFWEDTDGRFSTMIGDDTVTWLYVETLTGYDRHTTPVNINCWFGIENFIKMDGTRLFDKGSRFSVTFVRESDSEQWNKYWGNLDPECRNRLNPRDVIFCDISVTRPDGREYTDLGDLTELFISSNIMFYEDGYMQVAHIDKMLPVIGIDCPEPGRYSLFLLNHLGEPFIADVFESYAGSTLADKITPFSLIIIASAALVLGLAVGFLIGKKKYSGIKKTEPNDEE